MLPFGENNKSFILAGDFSKTMTIYGFIDSQTNPRGQKLIHEFGKEMKFNFK